jgi:hypothetical protein
MRTSPRTYRLLKVLGRYKKRFDDALNNPNMEQGARMRAAQRYEALECYIGGLAVAACSTYSDFD